MNEILLLIPIAIFLMGGVGGVGRTKNEITVIPTILLQISVLPSTFLWNKDFSSPWRVLNTKHRAKFTQITLLSPKTLSNTKNRNIARPPPHFCFHFAADIFRDLHFTCNISGDFHSQFPSRFPFCQQYFSWLKFCRWYYLRLPLAKIPMRPILSYRSSLYFWCSQKIEW